MVGDVFVWVYVCVWCTCVCVRTMGDNEDNSDDDQNRGSENSRSLSARNLQAAVCVEVVTVDTWRLGSARMADGTLCADCLLRGVGERAILADCANLERFVLIRVSVATMSPPPCACELCLRGAHTHTHKIP